MVRRGSTFVKLIWRAVGQVVALIVLVVIGAQHTDTVFHHAAAAPRGEVALRVRLWPLRFGRSMRRVRSTKPRSRGSLMRSLAPSRGCGRDGGNPRKSGSIARSAARCGKRRRFHPAASRSYVPSCRRFHTAADGSADIVGAATVVRSRSTRLFCCGSLKTSPPCDVAHGANTGRPRRGRFLSRCGAA